MDREKIELFKKNIHAQMMGISRQLNQSSDDEERYVRQNRVLMEYCIDFRRPFYKCARIVNEKYGYDLNEYDIEDILRKSGIRGVSRREEILNWADRLAEVFKKALSNGRAEDFKKFKEWREHFILDGRGEPYRIQERIGCLMLYVRCPELGNGEDLQVLVKCGNTMGKRQLYNITDSLSAYCGAGISTSRTQNMQLSLEQGKRRIEELERELERSNMMIKDLQEEMEDRMSEMQTDMLITFFRKLNSTKFGHILDQMYSLRYGFKKLQKRKVELPPDINGITIIIGNLYKFFSEYSVKKIREKNYEFSATKADLLEMEQDCVYIGEPFAEGEKKLLKVTAPGWRYGDSDIVISRSEVINISGHEEEEEYDH